MIAGAGELMIASFVLEEVTRAMDGLSALLTGKIHIITVATSGRFVVRLTDGIVIYPLSIGPAVHFRDKGACIHLIMELHRDESIQVQ